MKPWFTACPFRAILLCACLLIVLLCSTNFRAFGANLLLDEDFSAWPDRQWTVPGNWSVAGWRLFGTGGSAGSLAVAATADGRVLRITRTNVVGDLAADQWEDSQRLLTTAGTTVVVRFWARSVGGAATLGVNLQEFNGSTYQTGLDNAHAFALTTSFAQYSFQVALSAQTTEIAPGLRVQGIGVAEIQRIEIVPIDATLTYVDESFTGWSPLNVLLPGTWQAGSWRLFGVGGAAGQYQLFNSAEGPALRMTWSNLSGDAALDRDLDGLRVLAPAGGPHKFKIRARRAAGSSSNLRASLAEYDSSKTFTGIENVKQFTLTDTFADYVTTMTPSAGAVWLNPGLRVAGAGAIEIKKIQLLREGPLTPSIELPQGWTPNRTPTLYWRSPSHAAFQVQVASDSGFVHLTTDTGTLIDARNRWLMPAMIDDQRRFARVRVQDFAGAWSGWSEPTVVHYQPLRQFDPGTLYVYDLNPLRALSPAEAFEQEHFVAALAGLANRTQPRLYARWLETDDSWLETLRKPGRALEKMTPFHLGASQGYFRKTNGILQINRANVIGDMGLDRYFADQRIAVPPATDITLKVWARTAGGTNRLRLGLDQFSGSNSAPLLSQLQVFTLGSAYQLVSWPITTQAGADMISPSLRVDGIGTLQIQRIELVGTSNGQTYLSEDFTGWAGFDETLPGAWTENNWRMFGTTAPTIEMLVSKFPELMTGVVLYDPAVPATSNVASTIAGVEGLLPIPLRDVSGSLYRRIVTGGPKLPVVVNLVGKFTGSGIIPDIGEASSGSAKNDAYRWALKQYLEAGRCGAGVLANYIDYYWVGHFALGGDYANNTVTNHDYFIQQKAFFFDLSVWGDETPNDDPTQPIGTDKTTLKRILTAAAARLPDGECLHIGGFVPWAFKYVTPFGNHQGVASEWEGVRVFSNYNAYIDADALGLSGLANASIYSLMPRVEHYVQPPPPRLDECQSAAWLSATGTLAPNNYYANYIGDYDAAAWVMSQLPSRWGSRHRGREVLSWAWGPQLMVRGNPMFDSYVREATPTDSIWAADNGAGYLNPTQLTEPRAESGLPDGSRRWQAYCSQWYRRLGLRHSGFVIHGDPPAMNAAQTALYQQFSGDGLVTQWQGAPDNAPRMSGTMPVIDNALNELGSDPVEAATAIANAGAGTGSSRFIVARSILKPTDFYYDLDRELRRNHADKRPVRLAPAAFFYLMRHNLAGRNVQRAAVIDLVLDAEPHVGQPISGKVFVRNLGWEGWPTSGAQAVRVGVELTTSDVRQQPVLVNLPAEAMPGGLAEISFTLPPPAAEGSFLLRTDLQQNAVWFGDQGNLPDVRRVTVLPRQQAETAALAWHQFQ